MHRTRAEHGAMYLKYAPYALAENGPGWRSLFSANEDCHSAISLSQSYGAYFKMTQDSHKHRANIYSTCMNRQCTCHDGSLKSGRAHMIGLKYALPWSGPRPRLQKKKIATRYSAVRVVVQYGTVFFGQMQCMLNNG